MGYMWGIWDYIFVKLETTHVMTYGLHYSLSLIMIVQWTLEEFGRLSCHLPEP